MTSQRPGLANPWILNRWLDLLLFVAPPLLIIPLVAILQGYLSVPEISLYVLSFGAVGHHLPGMLRAYGDRELFARFRVRFIVAPLFLLAVCNFFAQHHLNGLSVVVLLWGTWHAAAQVFGFLRIYDAKAKSFSPLTVNLDMAMCAAWFGLVVVQSPERVPAILRAFYSSGGLLIPASMIHAVQSTWTVVAGLVTAAFVANWVWRSWQKQPPSTTKLLLMMITSIGFWWYSNVAITNIILGIAMFEIFHDVQYLAIVWVYNAKRVQTGHRVGTLTRFLFRRSWFLGGLYVGLVFAYGYINLVAEYISAENLQATLLGLVTASTFLHFYYDGFIWKVREKSIREGLGMSGGQSEPREEQRVPDWLIHGLKWCVFVVPVTLLATAEWRDVRPQLERESAILQAFPKSASAHNGLGTALIKENRPDEAIKHFHRATSLNPENDAAHNNWGNALQVLGRPQEAIARHQEALRIWPDYAGAHNNLGNALRAMGRYEEAAVQYNEALRIRPTLAGVHNNWGNVLLAMGRHEEAVAQYREALRVEPSAAAVHNNLGLALDALGHSQEAAQHFQEALRIKAGQD